jgi:glutamate 5-kinase
VRTRTINPLAALTWLWIKKKRRMQQSPSSLLTDKFNTHPGRSLVTKARSVTFKIGSSLLIDDEGLGIAYQRLSGFVGDMAALRAQSVAIVIVTSGAVALGRRELGWNDKVLTLAEKQAAAAAGQPILMQAWRDAFVAKGLKVAQILLTREDTENRQRWLKARATLATLSKAGVIAIINENDTVADEEIRFGDNDRLAARAAGLNGSDLLVLLSDVDGLYDKDPRAHKDAQRLDHILSLTPEIEAMAKGANPKRALGTGGMITKLMAAKIAGAFGIATIITKGIEPQSIAKLWLDGAMTSIAPPQTKNAAYKAWIAASVAPKGTIAIDDGAFAALSSGKSLLVCGISAIEGHFTEGETVTITHRDKDIARGISLYEAGEARAIMGRSSHEIEPLLGYSHGPELIHRDDLVML